MNQLHPPLRSKLALFALLAMFAIAMTSCGTIGVLSASDTASVKPAVLDVCDMHDDFVRKDATLSPDQIAEALGQSFILRNAFNAELDVATIRPHGIAVVRRHDAYVLSSTTMTPLEKKVAVLSSEGLERLLNANVPKPAAPPGPAPVKAPALTPPPVFAPVISAHAAA